MLGRILRQILRIASKADRTDFAWKVLRESSSEYRAYSDLFIPCYHDKVAWQSGLGDCKYVLYSIVKYLRPETVVEIGSARGLSTCTMSLACRQNACGKLFAIDPHDKNAWAEGDGSSLAFLKERLLDYELTDWCEIICSTSCEASSNWSRHIDVLFIDGDHTYDGVRRDFEMFKDWLTDQAIVIFHDTLWEYHRDNESYREDAGVSQYLEELQKEGYESVTFAMLPGLTLLYPKMGGFVFVPPKLSLPVQ